jgi:hypothetical protein
MGAIRPSNIRALPFGGTANTSTSYIGAASSPFLSGKTVSVVAGMEANALAVAFEIRNNEDSSGSDLYVMWGPKTGTFTAASGGPPNTALDNYITIRPGTSYSGYAWPVEEQINDAVGGSDYSILLVQAASGTVAFTGVVTVMNPGEN